MEEEHISKDDSNAEINEFYELMAEFGIPANNDAENSAFSLLGILLLNVLANF